MIKNIQDHLPGEATVFGIVDGLTVIDRQHYMTFLQPDVFPERDALTTRFSNIGARRQGTCDQPFPHHNAPVIGVGMGGALIFVPYSPSALDMQGVDRLCHVEFKVATAGNNQGLPKGRITQTRITHRPNDFEKAMAGMR